ncbi:MAG: hypothetical protein M1457_07150 [bacterium]|nr:hypothetical protein [bacterium]
MKRNQANRVLLFGLAMGVVAWFGATGISARQPGERPIGWSRMRVANSPVTVVYASEQGSGADSGAGAPAPDDAPRAKAAAGPASDGVNETPAKAVTRERPETDTPPAEGGAAFYPLVICPVTGEKLGSMDNPVVRKYNGREVRFCCVDCPAMFEKNLPASLKKLDEVMIKAQLPSYPLATCVVSGDKLGSMGEPVNLLYRNHLVRLCCSMHVKEFKAHPDKYLAKLDAAAKARKAEKADARPLPAANEAATHQHEGHGSDPAAGGKDHGVQDHSSCDCSGKH